MAGDMVQITIDGASVDAPPGALLLDVLRAHGQRIPTLCHDTRLTPYGGCRLCVVARRDGRGGLVPACSTPVLPGMVIETSTPDVIASRRHQLQLLLINHRLECPACERRGDCRLQDLFYECGVPESRLPFDRRPMPRDEQSPIIVRDPEKCIVCGKCVRLCDEVQGVNAIGFVKRGLDVRVATHLDKPLDCEFCGQCVNGCPVAALVARPYVSDVPVWVRTQTTTTCSFCSCGCQITAESHDDHVLKVSARETDAPNMGKLCPKGWLGQDVVNAPDRVTVPLVRREGKLVTATWDEALGVVAAALADARSAAAPVTGVATPRLTCEDAYVFQRLMRTAGLAATIGLGPTGGVTALTDGMAAVTGSPRSSATFDDMRSADVVLVLRADPTRTHPLVKTDLVQGARQRGQTLILAHALSGGLERQPGIHLPLRPASETALLFGLMAKLVAAAPDRLDALRALAGFDDWRASLSAFASPLLDAITGLRPERIDAAADALTTARKVVTVVVTGLGIPGDEAAVTRAAAMLDAVLGPAGGGVLVLGEKANLQGAIDVGLQQRWLPGGRPVTDGEARAALDTLWGGPLPPAQPPAAIGGAGGVVWVVGQDPLGCWPAGARSAETLAGAHCIVVQDTFLTETARQADVVLPVRILAEREGSMVAADGVRRRLRPLSTVAGLPQDGDIFREIGRRLGVPLPAGDALESEMATAAGWPLAPRRVTTLVPAAEPAPPSVRPGLLLDASPQLFKSGSITSRSVNLQQLSSSVAVRLSPRDATTLGVTNGSTVRIAASGREAMLRAHVDPGVRPGTVITPWCARWDSAAAPMIPDGEPTFADVRRSS